MAQKTAAMPQAALASVKRSATRNCRIIEKCLGRSALGIVRSIGSGVTLQQPKPASDGPRFLTITSRSVMTAAPKRRSRAIQLPDLFELFGWLTGFEPATIG